MSYQATKEYLAAIVDRYKKGSKAEKTKMLSEAESVTKLTRKHLVRLLKLSKEKILKKKSSGRPKKYPVDLLLPHIQFLWVQMERISAKRMKEAYSDWLPVYKEPTFTQELRLMVERMSISTLERILRQIRKSQTPSKGLTITKCPARYMKNKVALNTFENKIEKPGFFQSDTVGHCGTTTAGQYIHSVTFTDIFSAWTENRAIWAKQGHEVRKVFTKLEQELPFKIIAINTDNGSEFLNTPVLAFTKNADGSERIIFTRSRPYHKNDSCFVEQKNFTHVRELFGYERFEDPRLVEMMNEIYRDYWNPLLNFFIPTFKLKEKFRVGSRIVKKYDRPQTPYTRLINSSHLTPEQKGKLMERKKALNPFKLKAELEAKLKIFFDELRKTKTREVA